MRGLFALAATLACLSGSAWAKAPPPLSPDPFTASGRFDLPDGRGGPYALRLKIGQVRVDPALATQMKLEPDALKVAIAGAAERSLKNFSYQAEAPGPDAIGIEVELLPVVIERAAGGLQATARLQFKPVAEAHCLASVAEGRFRALDRQKSGAGRRTFAGVTAVALAFALVDSSQFVSGQMTAATEENKALNNLRQVASGEGVAPDFTEIGQVRYAATTAIQFAFADYIRQLGSAPACKAPQPAAPAGPAALAPAQ